MFHEIPLRGGLSDDKPETLVQPLRWVWSKHPQLDVSGVLARVVENFPNHCTPNTMILMLALDTQQFHQKMGVVFLHSKRADSNAVSHDGIESAVVQRVGNEGAPEWFFPLAPDLLNIDLHR